ncbi:MAG: hypothetical protein ACJAZF_000861, partial [Granulosicoccus sp.]
AMAKTVPYIFFYRLQQAALFAYYYSLPVICNEQDNQFSDRSNSDIYNSIDKNVSCFTLFGVTCENLHTD